MARINKHKEPVSKTRREILIGAWDDDQVTVAVEDPDQDSDIQVSWFDCDDNEHSQYITKAQARALGMLLLNAAERA